MSAGRFSVAALARLGKEHDCKQLILMAWDGKLTHCVTWGDSVENCAQAAQGGNRVKAALGWPETLLVDSPVVARLRTRVKRLEQELQEVKDRIAGAMT